jgi:VanZ family protein
MLGSTAPTQRMSAERRLSPARALSLLGPPLLVMAVIFYLSSQESGGAHGTIELLLRKLGHVSEYAVLTLCWWRALRGLGVSRESRIVIALAVGIALAYSASDEFHQTFIRGRHGTPVDVLIDSIGMGIAALVASRAISGLRGRRAPGP